MKRHPLYFLLIVTFLFFETELFSQASASRTYNSDSLPSSSYSRSRRVKPTPVDKSLRNTTDQLMFEARINIPGTGTVHGGYGFFLVGPNDQLFAAFKSRVDVDGPAWNSISWHSVFKNPKSRSNHPLYRYSTSYGPATEDEIVFIPHRGAEPACMALSIDPRDSISKTESVWIPVWASDKKKSIEKKRVSISDITEKHLLVEGKDLRVPLYAPLVTTDGNRIVGILDDFDLVKQGEGFERPTMKYMFFPASKISTHLKKKQEIVIIQRWAEASQR